jgi:hypothetical protein
MDKLEVEKVSQWKVMKESLIFPTIITNLSHALVLFKEE